MQHTQIVVQRRTDQVPVQNTHTKRVKLLINTNVGITTRQIMMVNFVNINVNGASKKVINEATLELTFWCTFPLPQPVLPPASPTLLGACFAFSTS